MKPDVKKIIADIKATKGTANFVMARLAHSGMIIMRHRFANTLKP